MQKRWYTRLDWLTLVLWAAIVCFGLVAIYSATHGPASEFLLLTVQNNFSRQLVWACVSFGVMLVILLLPARFFQTMAYPAYAMCMLLIVAALLFGREINGARSWLFIGPISLQSSELAKVGTILAIAHLFGSAREQASVLGRTFLGVGLLLLPAALIILQNDTGTALVFVGAAPFILFWSGIPLSIVAILVSPPIAGYLAVVHLPTAIAFSVLFAIAMFFGTHQRGIATASLVIAGGTAGLAGFALTKLLQPHQVARIVSFLDPEAYRFTSGFHVIQARAAIGSGGLTGKGFMQGTQTQMAFVPEQSTDFVFSVIGEEFGFIGSFGLLCLLGFLMVRLILLGTQSRHAFPVLFAAGTVGILFVHVLINVGMTVGVMPVIGIPLPFVSYGGSALVANTTLLAIILNLNMRRDEFPRYAI
ncbi:MAG TPA: rod shape-determining protein RodA [Rhodothermales bacterium]